MFNRIRFSLTLVSAVAIFAVAAVPSSANASASTEWKDGCNITAWQPTNSGGGQVGFKCNRRVYVQFVAAYVMDAKAFAFDPVNSMRSSTDFYLSANTWKYVTAPPPNGGASRYTRGCAKINGWSAAACVNSPGAYTY